MYTKKDSKEIISQGDIYQNFKYIRWVDKEGGKLRIHRVNYVPFFVVLTQVCDLKWDFEDRKKNEKDKRDKYIPSILVCPAYIAESFKQGEHLKAIKIISEKYGRDSWDLITQNHNFRFHFLEKSEELKIPELVLDFKHYYTLPLDIFYKYYKKHYLAELKPLYRENLSQRFAFFLNRIGLPVLNTQQLSE